MRRRLLALLLALAGCDSQLAGIPGTTTRVAEPEVAQGTELELKIFRDLADCEASVDRSEVERCLPRVDRANGEVRVGFQFRLDSDAFPMPIDDSTKDMVRVVHMGTVVQDGVGGQAYTIVPHDPLRVAQLFILVIDGSSSMADQNRIEKVRQALLSDEVKAAFFPDAVKTGVVLLQFTDGIPRPVGGVLTVVDNKRQYSQLVKDELRVLSGYTFLFNAVRYATGDLLKVPEIDRWVKINQAAPTVIALTDGFNNESRSDACRDNAARLSSLIQHLQSVRDKTEDLRARPTVFTVGLGRPLRPNFQLPDAIEGTIRPADLCGRNYVDRQIDGDLETQGIDNASLAWIAAAGGGITFVKRQKKGLGEAFASAAAERYEWFEARYRVDPFYLRRSFKTTLRLMSYANAEASVVIHPSAWLDAPPGAVGPEGWAEPRSFAHTATVMMPALGLLFSLSFAGAAWFNTSRAVFGRTRRPRRAARPSSAASNAGPTPAGPPVPPSGPA